MRSIAIAEQVLSMTTTPQRAAAIAGDLTEEAARRGLVWFWLNLFRITSSFVWQSWTSEPLRMLRLGVGAAILNSFVLFTLFAGLVLAITIGSVWTDASVIASIGSFGSSWSVMVSQFLTGRWLARRATHREIPACAAYLLIDAVFWISISVALFRAQVPGVNLDDMALGQLMNLASSVFVFIGINRFQEESRRQRFLES